MRFLIQLTDDRPDHSVDESFRGRITIGSFKESFISSATHWDANAYREHWHDAIHRVVREGKDSCLITSIADPRSSTRLYWWPMYRDGDTVHVQNGVCFFDQLPSPFDEESPYESVPPRERVGEDGEELSEWDVAVQDLDEFLEARIGLRWE